MRKLYYTFWIAWCVYFGRLAMLADDLPFSIVYILMLINWVYLFLKQFEWEAGDEH